MKETRLSFKTLLLVLIILASSCGIASAQPPPTPSDYSGYVTVDGEPAIDGTIVYAKIGGYTSDSVPVANGGYRYLVVAPTDSAYEDETIAFYVDPDAGGPIPAIMADETDTFKPRTSHETFNLTIIVVDSTPPVISGISSSDVTTSGAKITWTTDEPSTSQVDYGKTTAYGSQTTSSDSGMSHSVTLTGLEAGTTYHFRVKSIDGADNIALSGDTTFKTASTPSPPPFYPPATPANKPPVADAGSNQIGYVFEIMQFSGSDSYDTDGTIVSYEWDFGDGAEAPSIYVSHTYSEPGNYTVTLTVVDDRGEEDSDTCTIMVQERVIPVPPLPPFLDNLTITPAELELGDNVTISLDIINLDNQSITYAVDIHIENVNDPPPTWPPMDVYLRIWVDLGAYESKTVSHTLTMDTVGDYNVTVIGLTGSFTVEAPELPLKPAEFVVSDLSITPEEVEEGEAVTVSVKVTNFGEMEGSYTVEFKVNGTSIETEIVTLAAGDSTTVSFEETWSAGIYQVNVEDLTGSFSVTAPPKPAEFVFSDLRIFYPGIISPEVEEGETVTVAVSIEAKNVGELIGGRTVELKVNESVVDSQEVTLEGGASETVLFELTRGEGTYQVEVEGLTGSFTIDLAEKPPFSLGPGYIAGIVIVITSAGVVIYYIWKGKLLSTIFSDST